MNHLLLLFNRHFGRASLVAKFSVILNIGLAYALQGMRDREAIMLDRLLECHSSKSSDINSMLHDLGIMKENATNPSVKAQLTDIIESNQAQSTSNENRHE